jgi:hypothetical protein
VRVTLTRAQAEELVSAASVVLRATSALRSAREVDLVLSAEVDPDRLQVAIRKLQHAIAAER